MLLAAIALALLLARAGAQDLDYEYVVIGSGPGGGPLAANLARAGHSVFLIEAGEDHGDARIQRIPSFADYVAESPVMSWEFFVDHYEDDQQAYRDTKYTWRTANNTHHVGLNPPEGAEPLGILYPRAGTLGGCGNHNAMNLALPPDNDWQSIAESLNDPSWSATAMREYFVRIEHNYYISANGTGAQGHGYSGYLGANRNELSLFDPQPGFVQHLQRLFCAIGANCPNSTEALYELLQRDLNRIDGNRYEQNDLYQIPLHYDGMRRRSSSQTYLRDTVNELNEDGTQRHPLTISTSSLATRVLFNTSGQIPRATGVSFLRGQALYRADPRYNGLQVGQPVNVTATREVIVAGGAFNTPQILKLSGIGPQDELESFDIPVVRDLAAVGTNLQDNYEAGIHVEAAMPHGSPFDNCTFLAPGDPCFKEWEENGTGAYGLGAAPAAFLYRSSVSESNDTDLFLFGAAGVVFDGYYPGFATAGWPLNSSFWSMVKMQTQNRAGTVRLRSADPQDTPIINFNFFAEGREHDLRAIREGMEFILGIYNATPAPYGPYNVVAPDPAIDIDQAVMDQVFSHHAQSSCSMGVNANTSCVDARFRVHGVEGLRVVDGSVFPRAMGGFPVLPTFMISEKATDDILQSL